MFARNNRSSRIASLLTLSGIAIMIAAAAPALADDNLPISGGIVGSGANPAGGTVGGAPIQGPAVPVDSDLTRCIADFNQDGWVSPDDLADFIGAYFDSVQDQRLDINADGLVNPDDLADYIGAYFSGCGDGSGPTP